MHKFRFAVLAISALGAAPAAAQPNGQPVPPWHANVSAQIELFIASSSRGSNHPLTVFQGPPVLGDRTFTTRDVGGSGVRPGIGGTLRYFVTPRSAVSVRGLWLGEFSTESDRWDANTIFADSNTAAVYAVIPGTLVPRPGNTVPVGFNSTSIGAFQADRRSSLFSIEGNFEDPLWWVNPVPPGPRGRAPVGYFGWFAGARYIRLSDSFDTRSFFFDDSTLPAFIDTTSYTVRNNLIGGQIGVTGRVPLGMEFFLAGQVSGGLYANLLRGSGVAIINANPPGGPINLVPREQRSTEFSQGAEGQLSIGWNPMANVTVSVGYRVLWLNNVSRGQSHVVGAANANDREARADSSFWAHGVNIGLELRY